MVHLLSVHDSFHARVIAARLGSDGILTELRGDLDGPYPVAGEVRVYVTAGDLGVARELLLADEVEACFESPDDDADRAGPGPPAGGPWAGSRLRWLAALAAVLVLAMWLSRGL